MSCAGVVVPSGGDTAPGVTMAFKRFFLCFLVAGTFAACSNSLAPTTASSTGAGAAACTGTCTLTGQVVQQGTANGVASAALTLANGSGVVTTSTADATGAFSFPNLPAGVYALQTAAPGYVVAVANLTMPAANFTVELTPLNAPAAPSILAITVAGNAALKAGQTSQLTATVSFTDGTSRDATNVAKWTSNVPSVATISSTGLVTAYAAGSANMTASFQTYPGSLVVTVTQ